MLNLQEKEGVENYIKFIKDASKRQVEEDGQILPRIELFITKDPETGVDLKEVRIAVVLLSGEDFSAEGKKSVARNVRNACNALGAIGVIKVTEAWRVTSEMDAPMPRGSLEFHPKRVETVFIQVEHKTLNTHFIADITQEGDKKRVGNFVQYDGMVATSEFGAFTLPHNQN